MEEDKEITVAFNSPSKISPITFPSDVLKWMKLNANPKMALKLMKVCIYFQHANGFSFLVVKHVTLTSEFIFVKLDGEDMLTEDFKTIFKKLWIIGNIDINPGVTSVATLLSRTAVCNIQQLKISSRDISLDEFQRLTDGEMVERCYMTHTTITSENGEIVPLEDICECLPNARSIYFGLNAPPINSIEAAEAKISSNLERFFLCVPPNNYNLQPLLAYMMSHQKIRYGLYFYEITTEDFRQQFAPSVNKLLQNWSNVYKAPVILYCEVDNPANSYYRYTLMGSQHSPNL